MDSESRFLTSVPEGRLLDIGCGSGEWLAFVRDLGWQVEGIDFDEKAVKVAKQKRLRVKCGSLEEQNYPDDSFDAVTLNHVIEHIPDPVHLLSECARILKPGGKLALFTPNNASLGHRIFKESWRGLEPPRHLHLFSMQSMRRILALAGFQNISIHPQIAKSVIYESVLLRHGWSGSFPTARRVRSAEILARCFNLAELCVTWWKLSVADCVVAVALKQ